MWKNNGTNCKFCLNQEKCDSWEHCNWELSPTPKEKMIKIQEIESELRNIDWSNSQEATRIVISLEDRLDRLQVWYILFP